MPPITKHCTNLLLALPFFHSCHSVCDKSCSALPYKCLAYWTRVWHHAAAFAPGRTPSLLRRGLHVTRLCAAVRRQFRCHCRCIHILAPAAMLCKAGMPPNSCISCLPASAAAISTYLLPFSMHGHFRIHRRCAALPHLLSKPSCRMWRVFGSPWRADSRSCCTHARCRYLPFCAAARHGDLHCRMRAACNKVPW